MNSDQDWDADFDFDDDVVDNGKETVVLSGVAANPDEEENWDDVFDIDDNSSQHSKKSNSTFLFIQFKSHFLTYIQLLL